MIVIFCKLLRRTQFWNRPDKLVRTEYADMRSYVCLFRCQHLSYEKITSTLCATEAIFSLLLNRISAANEILQKSLVGITR